MSLTETDYVREIKSLLPEEGEVAVEVLELMEKAVAEYPDSSKLWCWRGDLIQMAALEAGYELDDALKSYERALEIDPINAEAYESIGYYEDVIMSDSTSAESPFRKAIELGAGRDSYYGLARVLAELNRNLEALEVISPENCPYHDADEIQEIKTEIESGMWRDDSA
jgi:tetratricopeptide (TPR) repeat protein